MAQIFIFIASHMLYVWNFCVPHTYAKYQTTCAKCGGLMTNMWM